MGQGGVFGLARCHLVFPLTIIVFTIRARHKTQKTETVGGGVGRSPSDTQLKMFTSFKSVIPQSAVTEVSFVAAAGAEGKPKPKVKLNFVEDFLLGGTQPFPPPLLKPMPHTFHSSFLLFLFPPPPPIPPLPLPPPKLFGLKTHRNLSCAVM